MLQRIFLDCQRDRLILIKRYNLTLLIIFLLSVWLFRRANFTTGQLNAAVKLSKPSVLCGFYGFLRIFLQYDPTRIKFLHKVLNRNLKKNSDNFLPKFLWLHRKSATSVSSFSDNLIFKHLRAADDIIHAGLFSSATTATFYSATIRKNRRSLTLKNGVTLQPASW